MLKSYFFKQVELKTSSYMVNQFVSPIHNRLEKTFINNASSMKCKCFFKIMPKVVCSKKYYIEGRGLN